MARRSIYITQSDAARLRELLRVQMSSNPKDRPNLRVLDEELKRARLVEAHRVKPDVVTMHSRLLVEDVATGEAMEVTLVFPEEADAANGRISVVAPMGAALLGYRA
ncbi:MAG TPA: GreA/GreB family elongation factor, partial [Phycisphaerae bacterium]|nr:GreA/GreB family elongation factor [Phycisphaerae bacterium]